jgi:hypothetical protein
MALANSLSVSNTHEQNKAPTHAPHPKKNPYKAPSLTWVLDNNVRQKLVS